MKKINVMLATALMFGAMALPANALTGTAIYVDGQYLALDTMPLIAENTTFVPLRAVSEALGANVDWQNGQAMVELGGKKITMQPGHKLAQVDGKALEMLAAPRLQGDRVLVPLRFVSEQLGAKVDYADYRIDIATEGAQAATAPAFEMCGEDEQYIYLNEGYDAKLTKIDKKTGEESVITLPVNHHPLLVYFAGNTVFDHNAAGNTLMCYGIEDGSEIAVAVNGGTPRIYGEYLYYLVNNAQTFAHDLYCVKLVDGKPVGDGTLVKSYVHSYFFAGGQVYTVSDNGRMFKMNADGGACAEIVPPQSDEKLYFRAFDNGYFYYSDYDRTKLYRFKQPGVGGGSVYEFVCDFAGMQIKRIGDIKVCGNKIYFNSMVNAEYMEGHWGTVTGPLWEMDLDGGKLRQVTEDKALEFYVLHDKIVYQTQTATGVEWKLIDK